MLDIKVHCNRMQYLRSCNVSWNNTMPGRQPCALLLVMWTRVAPVSPGITRGRGLSLGILLATTGLIVQSAAGHSPDFHVSILQIFSAQYLDPVWNVESGKPGIWTEHLTVNQLKEYNNRFAFYSDALQLWEVFSPQKNKNMFLSSRVRLHESFFIYF